MTVPQSDKVDIYSKIIELRKVPDEWLCQYFPTEEEEASANSSKIKLKLLSQKMDDQASLVSGWNKSKFIISSFIYRSISTKSITLIEDKFRTSWESAVSSNDIIKMLSIAETAHLLSGKVSTQRDKEAARKKKV